MSLIYDDIICYFMMNMDLLSSDLTAKITKISIHQMSSLYLL